MSLIGLIMICLEECGIAILIRKIVENFKWVLVDHSIRNVEDNGY